MTDNTIELHWENFETNAPDTFRNLWNDQDFADVTLATADDHNIRAHKVILSSCSQFFRNIFLMNPHQNPLLYLKDIRYKELALIMKLIYLGQCEVGPNELSDFLDTGSDLKVRGLMEDVNLKDIEEPVEDNGTQYTQEPQEPDSNYTDLDDKTREMSKKKNESEITIPSNQQKGGSFVCNECNAGFGSKTGILSHTRSKHEGVKYKCDQCDHSSNDNSSLTKHKQSIHEGVRYECDECDHKVTSRGSLTKHKQSIHEGVRYECDECDHKVTFRSSLATHKQIVHEGVRYECDECDYKATMCKLLTNHKQSVHEGVRYACDTCNYKATRHEHLVRHKQTKHM